MKIHTFFQHIRKRTSRKPVEPHWAIQTKIISPSQPKQEKKIRKNPSFWAEKGTEILIKIRNSCKTIWKILAIALVGGMVIAIFTAPIFRLRAERIEIVLKSEPLFDRTAVTSILSDFVGKNIFTISTQALFDNLSQNIRHIASVEKTLLFPDGIRVTITSFPPSFRAVIGEEVFLLTDNGQLIPNIAEVEVPALIIRHLVSDPNLQKSTPILIDDMTAIRKIIGAWRTDLPKYPINALEFYDQEKELHITTGESRLIFSLASGVEQIKTLEDVINNGSLKIERNTYIDCRIIDKLYTCAKGEEACADNITSMYD